MAARKTAAAKPAARTKGAKVATRDGLANTFTGMGMTSGRRGGDIWTFDRRDFSTLESMYRSTWMARKSVDIIPDDMTQEWRTWQGDVKDLTALENAEKKLKLRASVKQALKWARLYGGAAVIVSDGGDASKPLMVERVKKDGLKYAFPVAAPNLTMGTQLNWNPSAPNFGQPEFYFLTLGGSTQTKVHWSRVTRFTGAPYPDPSREVDCWGDSILDAIGDAIRDAGLSNAAGSQLMEEAKVDIVQMDGLENYLSTTDGQAKLQSRMELLRMGKSMFRILLMGKKEEYSSKTFSMANVDGVLGYFMQLVSGATDIPATRFLCQSPAGMNATGESDLRNYAQVIEAKQEDLIRPAMTELDAMLLRHTFGDVDVESFWYDFPSIWKMSPKEAAEVNKINSEADSNYANSGMIPTLALERAIQTRMIDSGLYPGMEDAIAELSDADLEQKRPDPAEIPLDPNAMLKAAVGAPGAVPAKKGAKKKPAKARR